MNAWSPLARPMFRALWIAAMVSNVGTWIHDVGAGWLMTELSPSPWMVSLVQAATTLPLLLLSVPAGALADVIDRRRLMLWTNLGMMLCAAGLAAAVWSGPISPFVLLAATLGLGIGAALINPAFQTSMVDLVPREELPAAAALNSVSLNLSRAVGPALGGLLVASAGPWAAFALNAASFILILATLWAWPYRQPPRAIAGERFIGAVKAGLRYVRHSPPMIAVLVRTISFVLPASVLWALMPLLAREHLSLGAGGYGVLFSCLGAGAVATTALLPFLRRRLTPGQHVLAASILYTSMLAVLALRREPWVGFAAMVFCGSAWVTMVVNLNVAAQSGTPVWVRGRALSCYLALFFGSMALGSAFWGAVAQRVGLADAFLAAAGLMLLGLLSLARYSLTHASGEETAMESDWEDPAVSRPISPHDGPVVVTIEYRIAEQDADAFKAAMEPVSQTRYRDGAISWVLSRCTENPERWLEVFIVESWAEHLRQHQRVTVADKRVQAAARAFHRGDARPKVSHFIAEPPPQR